MSEISRPLETSMHLNVDSDDSFRNKRLLRRGWGIARPLRWSIWLLIVGFCLYRISIFRPIPLDDSPGALRPLLYEGFARYAGRFANPAVAFTAWSELCLIALISLACLAVLNYVWREKLIHLPDRLGKLLASPALFWSLLALTLLLCRFPGLLKNELNPDESQFLASAEKLFYDGNFFRSVDCGTSGPLNIYPLMLPAIFGLTPDFASTRFIGLIAVFLSIFSLYGALTLMGSERLARLAILPVTGTFALFRHGELIHYSSEHIPFLLVSVAIFQGARLLSNVDRYANQSLFWMGFLASAAFFTKMQAVPIIVSVGAVSFAYVCSTRHIPRVRRSALFGVAGLLIPILFIVGLCLEGGVFRDFWRTYVRANLHYANAVNPWANLRAFSEYVVGLPEVRFYLLTVFAITIAYLIGRMRRSMSSAHTSLVELLVVSVAISASAFLPSVERSYIYAYFAVLCLCAAPVYFIFLFRERSSRTDPVKWFGFLAVVSACAAVYSVFKPQRYFFHYLLFLYIPLGAAVGYLFIRQRAGEEWVGEDRSTSKFHWLRLMEGRFAFLGAALVLTLGCEVYLWNLQEPRDFDFPPALVTVEGNLIRYLTSPGSKITVWGWDLRPYLSSGRVPATRDTTTITVFQSYSGTESPQYVPTPASERLGAIYRKRMLRDLQSNPPALFIDAIGPSSWFLRQREYWGFELIPSIKEFVDTRYVHLIDLYGQRYFLRRDLAAQREAEFNRPLPQLACVPGALLCSDTSITLPHELPATRIPAHAQMDIEFMPIHDQLGPATVFNTESKPFSSRGLRLQYVGRDRYSLIIGLGDHYAISREFSAPQGEPALVSIQIDGTTLTLEHNRSRIDEIHVAQPLPDLGGPLTVDSWIGGADPFSGKVQFIQILDLGRKENRSNKSVGKVR